MTPHLTHIHYIISYSFYTLFINSHWDPDYKSELACVKHTLYENTTMMCTDQCSVNTQLTDGSRPPGDPRVTWTLHVGAKLWALE